MPQKECKHKSDYLNGKRILPNPITKDSSISDLIENSMLAYNAGRLGAACELLRKKYSMENVTVGMSLAGALTPAGLGVSSIIPLMKHGFVDWISVTGANAYHDIHFALNLPLFQGSHIVDDKDLHDKGIVRIYDIFFNDETLYKTDSVIRETITKPEFQKEMSTSEFYHNFGKILDSYEKENNLGEVSIIAAAYREGIPVFTSSPGDSSIGMNIAALELVSSNFNLRINPSKDVNETAAIVLEAKKRGKSAVMLVGGGSPKNFMLQTEPQIQEVLNIPEKGHDYFVQITDARPDTGGLSGATPSEAVSWGKVDPEHLNETVIVYTDSTIALPLITVYLLKNTLPKIKKRLYDRREEMIENLRREYNACDKEEISKLEKLLSENDSK